MNIQKNKKGQQLDAIINKSMYYNANQLMSYNSIFSFVMGERGNGKTTQGIKLAINKKRKGFCTLYVRRTKEEMKKVKPTICKGVKEMEEYQDINFVQDGDWWYMNDEPFIYCLPLTDAPKFKSSALPEFDLIIFDEYVITNTGHNGYLPREMYILLDLMSTVFRERKMSVYIASNSVSYANPFFDFFDIRPKKGKRFITQTVTNQFNEKVYTVVVEFTDTKDYREAVKKSVFAKMVEGTSYYDYAICNEVLEDNNDFVVGDKPPEFDNCMFNIKIEGKVIGIWRMRSDTTLYYVGRKYDSSPTFNFNYAIYKNDIDKRYKDFKYFNATPRIKYFAKAYYENRVLYENVSIKNSIRNQVILFTKI